MSQARSVWFWSVLSAAVAAGVGITINLATELKTNIVAWILVGAFTLAAGAATAGSQLLSQRGTPRRAGDAITPEARLTQRADTDIRGNGNTVNTVTGDSRIIHHAPVNGWLVVLVLGASSIVMAGTLMSINSIQHDAHGSSDGSHNTIEPSDPDRSNSRPPVPTSTSSETTASFGQPRPSSMPAGPPRPSTTTTRTEIPPPQTTLTPYDVPAAFIGNWSGTQYQDKEPPYSYRAHFTITAGRFTENIGTADYPSLSCRFYIHLDSVTSSSSIEATTSRVHEGCKTPTMSIRIDSSGHLRYVIYDYDENGVLERVGHGDLTRV